jgi:septal ring-binding cell division protein DamX
MNALSNSPGNASVSPKVRRYPRTPVLFATIHVGDNYTGVISNLSEGGLCAQTTQPVAVPAVGDAPVRLRFQSLNSQGWVELEGKLIWRDEAGTQAGIEFIDVSPAAREEVQAWLSFGGSLKELRGTWATNQPVLEAQPADEAPPAEVAIEEEGTPPTPHDANPSQPHELPAIATPPLQFPKQLRDQQFVDHRRNSDQLLPIYRAAAFAAALCLIFLSAWAGMHAYAIRNVLGKAESLVSSKPSTQPPAPNVNPPRAPSSPAAGPARADSAPQSTAPQPAQQPKPQSAPPPPNAQPKTQSKAQLAASVPKPQPPAPASQAIKSSPAPNTTDPAPAKPAPATAKFALQLAAMKQEENANQLAQSLRSLKYPALVFKRPGDPFYRVIVGPYPNPQSAHSAKATLEKQSYPSILQPWKP